MDWTLDTIRAKIKELTGNSGLNDDDLKDRINGHYRDLLPLEFRLESLKYQLTVSFTDGVAAYTVDQDEYLITDSLGYIDDGGTGTKYRAGIVYDPHLFWAKYPEPTALGSYTKHYPIEILYDGGAFYPRPVPDGNYEFEVQTIKKPTALSAAGDYPVEKAWGGILACDVSIEIKGARGDSEDIEYLIDILRPFYLDKIFTKEVENLANIRGEPRF